MIGDLIRGVGPMAALLVLALGSGWLVKKLDPTLDSVGPKASHTPDYFIENFTTTRMNESGKRDRRLEAKTLVHYPDTNTDELVEPYLSLYPETGQPWEVRSERGWLSKNSDVVLLLGKVHIWRKDSQGDIALEIHTRDLRVTPKAEYGETDKPAIITTKSTQTRGVGMRANLIQGRVELLSQVTTKYAKKRP